MNNKCIGCGILLQDKDSKIDGYVSKNNYKLCERCFRIRNYGQNRIVNMSNTDYLKIFDMIKDSDLVVYISSLLTLNLDYVKRFKNLLLVLTKRDIIPKSVKDEKIINYVSKYIDNKNVLIVSAYKKKNLDILYNKMCKLGNNKKIYFVGSTNSGKSTLINEMIKSYGGLGGDITVSSFPSTTLSLIDVSIGNMTVYDTPGIVCEDSIINCLDTKDMKKISSKKEIKPITFQVMGSGSILLDNICRIDYDTNISSMTFYSSNSLDINKISLNNKAMLDFNILEYNINDNKDLVIEDIGFIKMTNKIKLKIYYKDKINIRVRDNLI